MLRALPLTRLAPLAGLASQCEVCRQWGAGGDAGALCSDCITRFALPQPRCARCGLRTGLATAACGACLHEPPPFEHTVCVADYGFPWQGLIAAFKFQGRPELAATLAPRLADAVRAAGQPAPHWVLPVPLSPSRLAERGYNQAWELARRTAALLQLTARADLLLRHREAPHQAELNRAQRQRNLHQAFMVEPQQRGALQGRRVALVDDVMTTGATAREAAQTLQRAGVAAVALWVLARTPEHDA